MRPGRLVLVLGTGTDVGKTWVSARLLATLRADGVTVAARKSAQSFDPGDDRDLLDAAVLAEASGEERTTVCRQSRWYEVALAPPMAADALGREQFTLAELVAELEWPDPAVEVGLVESAGGVRSPQTHDADGIAVAEALAPDIVLLVADAGLGTLNAVRLSLDALPPQIPVLVVLNRFDPGNDVHVRNRDWLTERDGRAVLTLPGHEAALAQQVRTG
jgi:dethiobiotin synthetase